MKNNMRKTKGFTLIELVVVIVILGVLSAVAVPKFVDLQSEARTAVMEGVEGAIRGAATLVYSKSLIEAKESIAADTVAVTGGNVITAFGYPAALITGIEVAVDLSSNPDIVVVSTGLITTYTFGVLPNCNVVYTDPVAVNTAPTVLATTTGC